MGLRPFAKAAAAQAAGRQPFAIVDVGSNSVRLVIYDSLIRSPVVIFNEKVLCGLGRGLARTGRLNEDGVRQAVATLARFAAIAESMNVAQFHVVATAAVRDAVDGPEFISALERCCGVSVEVVSGAEEARLSAMGVLCGLPEADGLTGDIGGGSVELTQLTQGTPGAWATLPLGPLRLVEIEPSRILRTIDSCLEGLPWLEECRGRTLYPVGGAWRNLARIHIAQTNYPLHVVDHYSISGAQADELTGVIARLSGRSLEKIPRVPRRRLDTLPLAAMVLRRLLRYAQPARLVFSAQGLREGYFFGQLPEAVQRQDPLLATCADLALRFGRVQIHRGRPLDYAQQVSDWMAPLFPDADPRLQKLRAASCLLGDIAWSEHPDYRADQSFSRILRLPFLGSDHPSRMFIAYAVFTRYEGDNAEPGEWPPPHTLLDDESLHYAAVVGLALKLAAILFGGPAQMLPQAPLTMDQESLELRVQKAALPYLGEAVERALEKLARALGRRPAIVRPA